MDSQKSEAVILERAQATIQSRQESMLTSVRSLIAEGRIDLARNQAYHLKDTEWWEEAIEAFKPSTAATCERQHQAEWRNYGTAWHLDCTVCRDLDLAEEKQKREEEEAFLVRPYRHHSAEEVEAVLSEVGIPARFKTATVKRLESTGDSLYLIGPRGTGKTHMAAAIIREIVLDRTPKQRRATIKNIKWISVPDLLLEIRATFRDGSERSEMEIIEEYSDCRILVLDDLGAEKTSEWSLQTLYTIIDRRYREERQTIITSNLSLDELAAQVDDRIASRLSELCRVVVLAGADRRVSRSKKQP